ncbi:hypothetical protein [Halopseudomonas sp.]|uniref:hypothetical protein n=1 Tax=Halopseudomonas sp. TaxID=2901191 RepID=UPI00300229E2
MDIRKASRSTARLVIASVVIAAATAAAPVAAQSLKDGYAGCLTEDYLDQFISAAVKDDMRAINYLLEKNLCVPLSSQFDISVLDPGFTQVKIRVYVGNDAVDLWTVREAVKF